MQSTITLEECFSMENAKRVLASGTLSQQQYHDLARYIALGTVKVSYTVQETGRYKCRVKGKGNQGIPCYANMIREVRAWLAQPYYHDIDMVNSQPSLITQIFGKEDISCPALQDYVQNRKKYIQDIQDICNVSNDVAKNLFITLCNNGTSSGWKMRNSVQEKLLPQYISILEKEMHNNIHTFLTRHPELKRLQQKVKPDAQYPSSSQFSYYCFQEERRCLYFLYTIIKKSKRIVGALIHDGLLVKKDGTEQLPLDEWEEYVQQNTGYTIKLIEKPMELNPAFVGKVLEKKQQEIVIVDKPSEPLPLISASSTFIELKSMLEQIIGFKNVKMIQTKELGFSFDADRTCRCPLCNVNQHEGNWYITTICPQVFAVRSYASRCRQRLIGFEKHQEVQDILQTPDTDEPYVALFKRLYGNIVMWTGKRFMLFEKHRWHTVSSEKVYDTLAAVSIGVLERLLDALGQKKIELDLETPTNPEIEEEKKQVKEQYQNTIKGIRYVKKHSNLTHIVEMTKCKLHKEKVEEQFDANPWLLGLDNGVIDMSTPEWKFRDGKPEDMISQSVGYNYDQESALKYKSEVNQLFSRIYPNEEEREIVQRYFACCLLGYHPQKKFLILTDARGGYNGKSTVCKAIRSTLGQDYSVKPLPCFLYRSDRVGNIDSHAAGILSYRAIRLATIEELDPKQLLDVQFIKDINGGRTSFRGRVIRSDEHIEFEWRTKQIIAFNGGNMPRFDIGDKALLERMMVVKHQARFCPTKEEYELEKHIPYTYEACPDLDEKIFGVWKSALLEWCLEGLKRYHEVKFTVLPPACKTWTKELAQEQDLVGEFVNLSLEYTGNPKEFITRAELYATYKASNPEERDKKTALGKSKFFERIKSQLGDCCHKSIYGPKRDRDVFVGWKWIRKEQGV